MSEELADRVARVWDALDAGELEEAWREAEPLRPALGVHLDVARVWLRLLGPSPERASRVEELRAVLEGFPADPLLVHEAAGLLLREDEAAPLDEPRAPHGPAALAAAALVRCLAAAPAWGEGAEARAWEAALQVRLGGCLRLLGPGADAQARAAFEAALALAPRDVTAWYDYGLCHKYAGRFAEALAAFRAAAVHMGEEAPALWWNVGICATGAGDAVVARHAWERLGLAAPPPGRVQVRLSSGGAPAQGGAALPGAALPRFAHVAVEPRSPCHGRVVQGPPGAGWPADTGDVVLWDAVPLGEGAAGAPCFPLLAVLERAARGPA